MSLKLALTKTKKEANKMDDKKYNEMIEEEAGGEERLNLGLKVDPVTGIICGSSISMLASGIALPFTGMTDNGEDERDNRE